MYLKGNEKLVQETEIWIMLTIFVKKNCEAEDVVLDKNKLDVLQIFSSRNTRIAYVGSCYDELLKELYIFFSLFYRKKIYFSLYYIKFIMQ